MTESEVQPIDALSKHAGECSECRIEPAQLTALGTALRAAPLNLEAAVLSRRVLQMVAPELARLAARAFRRRVALGIGLALVPLPAVLVYDAFVLRTIYALLSAVLPSALAAYFIGGMALSAAFLIAASYAVIPLVVDRQFAVSRSAPA